MDREIYFDNSATTCVDSDAAKIATDVMCSFYGNPSSVHAKGIESSHILKKARKQVLSCLGLDKDGSVIFTSCGTEANNTAIFSAYEIFSKRCDNIVISDSEHPSVENCARILESKGITVHRIPTKNGKLDIDFAKSVINSKTFLVSCMLVNNETGAIYDVKSLRKIRDSLAPKAYFHVDAVQGFAKLNYNFTDLGADLITLSAHKIHAVKGCGALYIKKGIRIIPRLIGGGQESSLRSGTENLPAIAAFGHCCDVFAKDKDTILNNYEILNKTARENIFKYCPEAIINSGTDGFAHHILSVSLPGIRSEILLRFLSERSIYVSSGSACSSNRADNRVLSAFGLDEKIADSTIRISFSKYNTKEQTEILAKALKEANEQLIHTL